MGNLQQLRTFWAVYRHGSMTGAASALHLSQPSVSAHLHDLEVEIGAPLFIRHARGVEPTSRGITLAQTVGEPLEALAAVEADLRIGKVEGTVVVGGPPDLLALRASAALTPLLAEGARLRLQTGLADELIASLAADEIDLAIAAQQPRHAEIVYESLFSETLVLVGAPPWLRRLGRDGVESKAARALAEVPWLALAEDLPFIGEYCRTCFEGWKPSTPAVTLADMRGLTRFAVAGAGVTVLPDYVVEAELRAGELVVLHHPPSPPRREVALAYHSAGLRRPGVAAVREALLGAAAGWRTGAATGVAVQL